MPQGTNTSPNFLWKLRFKINTPDGGLNWLLQIAEKIEADAVTIATDIAARFKSILPSVCTIYACTLSKSNTKKDSRIIAGAIGSGLYGQVDENSDPTVSNKYDDAILVRFENEDGGGVSMAIGPVPDTIITDGEITLPISSVTDMAPAVAASAAQPVTYATEFTKLMHAIGKNCNHVQTKNNEPGGTYTYYVFNKAHVKRVTRKKKGRVFVK